MRLQVPVGCGVVLRGEGRGVEVQFRVGLQGIGMRHERGRLRVLRAMSTVRVPGAGCRVQGAECRVQGAGFRDTR
jgi:hypothetical protein